MNDGLVAYYPFNGNANDESGNGNNGTVNGASLTTDRFGDSDKAFYFNNNNISIQHNSLLNISNSFTIDFWYNPSTLYFAQDLITKGADNNDNFWIIRHHNYSENPFLNFSIRYANQTGHSAFISTPTINTWHNICVKIDGSFISMFKNGELINSGSSSLVFQNNTNTYNLIIGTLQYNFNGKIDDIRIYNRALTQEEITYLATH